MEAKLEIAGKDMRPRMMRRLSDLLRAVKDLLSTGFEDRTVTGIAHDASDMLKILNGNYDADAEVEENLQEAIMALLGIELPDDVLDAFPLFLDDGEDLSKDGSFSEMIGLLRGKSSSLWKGAESLAETLWVGGLLYADIFSDMASRIMAASGDVAMMLGTLIPEPVVYGLSWSPYFKARYDIYYAVYEKAGMERVFAPLGQKKLRALAEEIHAREDFFDSFLSDYDGNKETLTPSKIGVMLSGFRGSDRRVELLKRLSREEEVTGFSFSTFDPMPTMVHLIEEIRADYYGGVYVPPGENEAAYRCIATQFRAHKRA